MMDIDVVQKTFNEHLDMWKEWSMHDGFARWVDNAGYAHDASSISELKAWFESHMDQN